MNNRIIILLISSIISLSTYAQPIHDPVEFTAQQYNRIDINHIDENGLKQGRFVFTPLTCSDTNSCKMVTTFTNDSATSKWTVFKADSTYEIGDYKLNMKWTNKGGLKYLYPIKIGKWFYYSLNNEMLYYKSHNSFYNKEEKDTYWSDTIFNKNGIVIGYDIKSGFRNTKKEFYKYKSDTLLSYNLTQENKGKITKIEINYFKSGLIKNETHNNSYKCYYSSGKLKELHIKKIKLKKGPGAGEGPIYYSTTKTKITYFDESGNKKEIKKYKNGELIKQKTVHNNI
jgi:hypothetical protein